MNTFHLYKDMEARTNGEIYIGVVGPVRTGKSTFIKRFMDLLVSVSYTHLTLTNMSDHDIERIIAYHLEPINISIHTMNPELRCRMLHNRFAGDALKKLQRLYEGGIQMNGQIVLCKGFNDGKELERSIREMSAYAPLLQSVSVVPVGLTKYREGLEPLESFTKEDAVQVLDTIHRRCV